MAFNEGAVEFVYVNMQIHSIASERASAEDSLVAIRFGVSGVGMHRKIQLPHQVTKFSKTNSLTAGYQELPNGGIQPEADAMIKGRGDRGDLETFMAHKLDFAGISDLSKITKVYPSNLFAENR